MNLSTCTDSSTDTKTDRNGQKGKRMYQVSHVTCHAYARPGERSQVGPNMSGVVEQAVQHSSSVARSFSCAPTTSVEQRQSEVRTETEEVRTGAPTTATEEGKQGESSGSNAPRSSGPRKDQAHQRQSCTTNTTNTAMSGTASKLRLECYLLRKHSQCPSIV